MDNRLKLSHLCVFGWRVYIYLLTEVCANKLAPYSELMIFIRCEDNGYCFMYYTQENFIFYSIYTIFDKKFFSKCTNSYAKEYKLYNRLLDKISLGTESLVPRPSDKDRPTPILIPYIPISIIQNNSPPYSPLLFFSYKSLSFLPSPVPKKPTVEVDEVNNVDSNVEMQPLRSQ